MSGADYLGGCQHQSKEPCEACREHKEKFDALFASLPRVFASPGSRFVGVMSGSSSTSMAKLPDGSILVVQSDGPAVVVESGAIHSILPADPVVVGDTWCHHCSSVVEPGKPWGKWCPRCATAAFIGPPPDEAIRHKAAPQPTGRFVDPDDGEDRCQWCLGKKDEPRDCHNLWHVEE